MLMNGGEDLFFLTLAIIVHSPQAHHRFALMA